MTARLRIALAQLNPTVGALSANLAAARTTLDRAEAAGADIVLFPELYLTGYIPEDLLFRERFIADAIGAAEALVRDTAGRAPALLLPTIWRDEAGLRNAVLYAEDGALLDIRYKVELPGDDVFYEPRYFVPGPPPAPMEIRGVRIGVPICEDIWHEPICKNLAKHGAEILLCPNGSPYWRDKQPVRRDLVARRVSETGLPLLYANQVGGQDELVFDGASFGVDGQGALVFQGESFAEDMLLSDWEKRDGRWHAVSGKISPLVSSSEAPWRAAMLGLADYVRKNGFEKVVLGLSGGIDSAVVAAIAVDALGPDNVHCVMLPYHYTSDLSLRDARACADALGVRYDIVPIADPVEGAGQALAALFAGLPADLTEENLQSRTRGTLLMAISNKFGALLLTTGNKSEMAVGYATIYGDMNGAYNPLKDMLKTEVYALARWRNANLPGGALGPSGVVIPEAIITRPPSAELRADQTDQDSLPPYEVLDAIITGLVESERSAADIVADGHDAATVNRVARLIAVSEFKRRQAAPGPKLTRKAFGLGRKYPITSGWRDGSAS